MATLWFGRPSKLTEIPHQEVRHHAAFQFSKNYSSIRAVLQKATFLIFNIAENVNMKLTQYSDLGFRLMMYLAMCDNKIVTIQEVSDRFAISKNHLVKISHQLTKSGLIESVRGRNGGIRLALPAKEINLEMILRVTEDGFDLVECFDPEHNQCVISDVCKLNSVFDDALEAFLGELRKVSLADLAKDGSKIESALMPFPGTSTVKFHKPIARPIRVVKDMPFVLRDRQEVAL